MKTVEQQAEQLFEKALQEDAEDRVAFVEQYACGNPALCQLVLELLEHHGTDEQKFILDRPLLPSVRTTCDQQAAFSISSECEGDIIGRYKLLERLGEGGMGTVYMAEQISDVRRRVALKIIKLGMDTRQVVARFEAERQAMALFDHPGITRILDAGATDAGRPFYVMELVKGQDIISFAQQHRLSLEQRLAVFIDVCHAVQHAHQKGIIHRDIKPSNILVAMIDGKPVPKIIDFGIAKALHHRLTDLTLFTRYSAMMGTPQYMSPEQAQSSGVDVDTRSDIYGLGVLLYELITGTTPLTKQVAANLNPLALVETLRNQTIETPSTRVSRCESTEQSVPTQYRDLRQTFKKELDWVVMKSLAQDRSQRYQSASELSADVQRYLDGDPVEAAAPSRYYRIQSHILKHRRLYTIGASSAVLVIALSIFSTVFAIKSHYANLAKAAALDELSTKNEQLSVAQAEIEKRNRHTRITKAIQIAEVQFDIKRIRRWSEQLSDVIQEQASQGALDPTDDLSDIDGIKPGKGSEFSDDTQLESMLVVDSEVNKSTMSQVIESLKYQDLVRYDLEPFQEMIRKQEAFANELSKASQDLSVEEEPIFQSPPPVPLEDLFIPTAMRPIEDTDLIEFFRSVVDEYRREFGNADPQVASGLNLLSAALLQMGQIDEAIATLREAKAIGKNEQTLDSSSRLFQLCCQQKKLQSSPNPNE